MSAMAGRSSAIAARLARLDAAMSRFEAVVCVAVIGLEIAAFSFWIALKGLSTPAFGAHKAGLVFRAALGAFLLGVVTYRWFRPGPRLRALSALGAAVAGVVIAWALGDLGTGYFANWLNWLQDASALTLLGGLRGVGTELTWWLAMLGGSLATGSGKHINIDVLLRFAPPRLRLPTVALGWIAAGAVCLAAVWGFFDHIAIDSFGADAGMSPGEKVSRVIREGGRHLFLLRKQLGLDVATLIHVLAGQTYDSWLYGTEWNEWVRAGGWEHFYPEQDIQRILLPDEALGQLHPPLVVLPSGGSDRGLLARDLHLIFPLGLFVIGARLLLRAGLVGGQVQPIADEQIPTDDDSAQQQLEESEPAPSGRRKARPQ
jgi:multisubunit Na+/H+ antiporter MnhB subunit